MTAFQSSSPHVVEPMAAAVLDRSLINAHGESFRYLVVTVRAPKATKTAGPRLPFDLGLVLDASGSMRGERLDAARSAVRKLLDALQPDDRVSLVSFADDVVVHTPAVALDASGTSTLQLALDALQTRGSTDLAAGWLQGCECVAQRRAKAGRLERDHVFLFSDGHANLGIVDPNLLAGHANALRERGVPTSTIGIGGGYSPVQLQAIAEAGGGRMHDAERPEEIAEIVLAELGDARDTVLQDVELDLDLPPGVEAFAFGTARVRPRPRGLSVLLGAMLGDAERTLVVRLRCPAGHLGETLAVAPTLFWKVAATGDIGNRALPACTLTFALPHQCVQQPRDLAASTAAAMQWQVWVLHWSMQQNQDGDLRGAQLFVAEQLRHLQRYCEGLPEGHRFIDALRRLLPTLERRYDVRVGKEVMLASYKRGRGEFDKRSMMRDDANDFLPPQ